MPQPPQPVGGALLLRYAGPAGALRPRLATRLLRWFLAWHRLEELEGDLEELFQQRVQEVGVQRARWRYVRDGLSLLRPSLKK